MTPHLAILGKINVTSVSIFDELWPSSGGLLNHHSLDQHYDPDWEKHNSLCWDKHMWFVSSVYLNWLPHFPNINTNDLVRKRKQSARLSDLEAKLGFKPSSGGLPLDILPPMFDRSTLPLSLAGHLHDEEGDQEQVLSLVMNTLFLAASR